MLKYLLPLCLLCTPCLAQQQQQQPTPTETALEINTIIGTWAQALTRQARVIEELQKQLAVAQAKIKELESKEKPDVK